jgi:hypothetical protein
MTKMTCDLLRHRISYFFFAHFVFYNIVDHMILGPTQPPIQWVVGAISMGVKRPGREADHSPPSSAEVKERVELYLHYPNTPSWRGAQLKHRDNFTFTFMILIVPRWDAICMEFMIASLQK